MIVLTAAALGAFIMAGLLFILRAVSPRRFDALGYLVESAAGHSLSTAERRLAATGSRLAALVGLGSSPELARDLAMLDRSTQEHFYRKTVIMFAASAATLLSGALTATSRLVAISPLHIVVATVFAGLIGFVVPDLKLRSEVEQKARSFTEAFAAYLELVVIRRVAGGDSVGGALVSAAEYGDGWAFAQLRGALDKSRYGTSPPWTHLKSLGWTLDNDDILAFADLCEQHADTGAALVESTAERAKALRRKLSAETLNEARGKSTSMAIPVALSVIIIAVFVIVGALTALTVPNLST